MQTEKQTKRKTSPQQEKKCCESSASKNYPQTRLMYPKIIVLCIYERDEMKHLAENQWREEICKYVYIIVKYSTSAYFQKLGQFFRGFIINTYTL